jgi:hypothetical protein
MRAGSALLDPADVQGGRSEVHLLPAEVHQLGYPEAVPVGDEDHGGIPVAPPVALRRFHEPLDLGLGLGEAFPACAARRWEAASA